MFCKKITYTFLFLVLVGLLLSSCSEYQQTLRGDDLGKKFSIADSLYKAGKYKKGLKLMEQIVPSYRGKPQAEKLMFIYANTFYKLGDNYLAGYQFERFVQAYPTSDSAEVASFRGAKSFYELSNRYSLDQKETYKGLEKLQEYVNAYPDSPNREEANVLVSELQTKLDKKDFEIANQYLKIGDYIQNYNTAIVAFENFINDHPGSIYRKDAFFGRFKAGYLQAINSLPSKVNERLVTAKTYYNSFVKYYADSDLKPEADKILADIEKRMATNATTEEPTSK